MKTDVASLSTAIETEGSQGIENLGSPAISENCYTIMKQNNVQFNIILKREALFFSANTMLH
jgi:hypothetical protein